MRIDTLPEGNRLDKSRGKLTWYRYSDDVERLVIGPWCVAELRFSTGSFSASVVSEILGTLNQVGIVQKKRHYTNTPQSIERARYDIETMITMFFQLLGLAENITGSAIEREIKPVKPGRKLIIEDTLEDTNEETPSQE